MSRSSSRTSLSPGSSVATRVRRRAFSLIELLVVMAIVGILTSTLLPCLSRAKDAAKRAREQAAAAQVMMAYEAYASEHGGRVMPGYPTSAEVAGPMRVLDAAGTRLSGPVAQRYPWRLAPYLGYHLNALYLNADALRDMDLESRSGASADVHYLVSLFPRLGLNTRFVGGDSEFYAFSATGRQVFGRFWLERTDEARDPTSLIVLASSRAAPNIREAIVRNDELFGFHRVLAPSATAPLWEAQYDAQSLNPVTNSGSVSLPDRERGLIAAMDGHAEFVPWRDLRDMRRWSHKADTPDWVLRPR
jgi:prepilin-type N-terminal cleavage/methylation domain-containing protein